MADLAEAEQEQPLPDVPLHQRGFGKWWHATMVA
jgi:hypothetical protein